MNFMNLKTLCTLLHKRCKRVCPPLRLRNKPHAPVTQRTIRFVRKKARVKSNILEVVKHPKKLGRRRGNAPCALILRDENSGFSRIANHKNTVGHKKGDSTHKGKQYIFKFSKTHRCLL